MSTSEISSTNNGLVDILSLLEAYQLEHEEATSLLKKAFLEFGESTAFQENFHDRRFLLVADNVREELRPRVVLIDASGEPACSGKQSTLLDQEDGRVTQSFITADPIHLFESMKENQSGPSVKVVDEGLRQRKNETKSPPTAWTVEQHEFYDEEARLSRIDPLDLFGGTLNPRELKIAQEHAKKSLDAYVKVANLKIDIEQRLEQMNDKKKDSTI